MVLLFGYVIFGARNFPALVKTLPMIAGILGFIAGMLLLVGELRGGPKEESQEGIMDVAVDRSMPAAIMRKRYLRMAAWFLVFYLGIWVLGFKLGAILFLFLFTKFEGKVRWLPSIVLTVMIGFGVVIQLGKFLGVFWPEGLLAEWIQWPRFL